MDNFFDELMECIFIESNFSLAKIDSFDEIFTIPTSIYIAHKPHSDYFIYFKLPEKLLPNVTDDIQIKLASLFKEGNTSFEMLNGDEIKITSSFEKNATLIIFTDQETTSINRVAKHVISIEEDPYFFKKQVLAIPSNNHNVISDTFNEHKSSYISYLQNLISDTEVFNKFMISGSTDASNEITEYSFAAKLYEKLPFLALSVERSTQGDLQEGIDNELSQEQREQCDAFWELDLNQLDDWFAKILKEEKDD